MNPSRSDKDPQAMYRIRNRRGLAGTGLLLIILILAALWWFKPWEGLLGRPDASRKNAVPRSVAARGTLAEDEQNNIAVFKNVSPSVVHITTLELARSFLSLDVMQIPRGTGTGFIWDDRGKRGHQFPRHSGRSIGPGHAGRPDHLEGRVGRRLPGPRPGRTADRRPQGKAQAHRGRGSRELQVGQKVYAIGNPFGLDQTLTTGIISALNREIESATQRPIRGVIQTDAAINPGNSGGPLLDSAGRLIGVNTAIFSPSGASAGIGFAIPVDEVNRVVPRLIRDGKFIRPALGIQAAGKSFQEALGLPRAWR